MLADILPSCLQQVSTQSWSLTRSFPELTVMPFLLIGYDTGFPRMVVTTFPSSIDSFSEVFKKFLNVK